MKVEKKVCDQRERVIPKFARSTNRRPKGEDKLHKPCVVNEPANLLKDSHEYRWVS